MLTSIRASTERDERGHGGRRRDVAHAVHIVHATEKFLFHGSALSRNPDLRLSQLALDVAAGARRDQIRIVDGRRDRDGACAAHVRVAQTASTQRVRRQTRRGPNLYVSTCTSSDVKLFSSHSTW